VGHEHFGFKDGVSQPGIRGITDPFNEDEPSQGQPGQDLLHPGEFVIGYSKQDGVNVPGDDPNDDAAPAPDPNPEWTRNGSYLVYRRLRQNVKGFNDFVAEQQAELDGSGNRLTTEMGANLVGRYRSGCPFETIESLPTFDPLLGDPTVPGTPNSGVGNLRNEVLKDEHINNFEYAEAGDEQGFRVPRAAHIRKVYPRNAVTPAAIFHNPPLDPHDPEANEVSEANTQTHRILRRGIPFGASFVEGSPAGSPHAANVVFPADRGLNFLCYQTDIGNQWQFVQSQWVNNPSFPNLPDPFVDNNGEVLNDGHDPIISQSDPGREFTLPLTDDDIPHLTGIPRWVTTTGGEYFFQPSIDALCHLAQVADSDEVSCHPNARLRTTFERVDE
jgi:Dyp-type peroxidase family